MTAVAATDCCVDTNDQQSEYNHGHATIDTKYINHESPHMTDSTSSMPIRPVRQDDHDELVRMRENLWPSSSESPGSSTEHAREVDAFLSKPQDGVTFVIERPHGKLGGFIEISLRSYAENCVSSPVPYIEGWYVDEELRRTKLGSRLVRAVEEWARRHGFKEIASDTALDNDVSIQAHKALGFASEQIVCFWKEL